MASYILPVPHLCRARQTIAELGSRFIRANSTVLTHGYSRVVLKVLQQAFSSVSAGLVSQRWA